jgi:hypothetical protein
MFGILRNNLLHCVWMGSVALKADSHVPCRSPAVLKIDSHIPCWSPAILWECSVSHWPPTSEIGMLLITNFLELGVASRQYTVTLPPRPCHGLERSLSERHIRDMACENQTRPHCVNQMGKTQSKALVQGSSAFQIVRATLTISMMPAGHKAIHDVHVHIFGKSGRSVNLTTNRYIICRRAGLVFVVIFSKRPVGHGKGLRGPRVEDPCLRPCSRWEQYEKCVIVVKKCVWVTTEDVVSYSLHWHCL